MIPSLFVRRRREIKTTVNGPIGPLRQHVSEQGTPYTIEQRIHPDQSSLAEELIFSQRNDERHSAVLPSPPSVFAQSIGLEPSSRRRLLRQEVRIEDKRILKHDPTSLPDGIAGPSHSEAHNDKVSPTQKGRSIDSSPSDTPFPKASNPVSDLDMRDRQIELSSIKRWPTFGKRQDRQAMRDSSSVSAARSASRSESQSSLSQPRSRATSRSYFTSSEHTPGSPSHSLYTSTPYSRHTPSSPANAYRTQIPSPHTFGMPTPPQPTTSLRHKESYFDFKGIPPPLPPLDHPAFRESTSEFGVLSTRQGYPDGGQIGARHSYSLPSLKSLRPRTKSEKQKDTRARTRSSTGTGASSKQIKPLEGAKKVFHSRNHSKSSVASSRRSSAEYSAKQASSMDHGGWEVDVTKAMISLALGEVQRGETRATTNLALTREVHAPSVSGKARGDNWQSDEVVVTLDSPFCLQDPVAHNLTDSRLPNDYRAGFKPQYASRVSSVAEKRTRDGIMSHEESMIPTTGSSANPFTSSKGKKAARDGSPSPKGTGSRRGGARTISYPSRTRTPSPPPAKIDTVPLFGSIQGTSSLLAPPQLSITAPTPEASPISPARRTHHKSTPTMPTKSVLRTPSTPPIIEKSHSSGSGKRKAEEADMGGDKTPPKDQRSTSFAPEPRTHRASATSNSSGHAPSSFNRSKRVRLTESSEGGRSSRSGSRSGTLPRAEESPANAKTTGSWSSKGSHGPKSVSSHREHSYREGPPIALSASHGSHGRAPSRRSLSQASIPLSALVSPHAPSVTRSGTFHMRDPRKPPPVQSTPWSLSFPDQIQDGESRWSFRSWVERGGSPIHAWFFFIGFIIFPLWWAAVMIPIPRTRRLGGTDMEKGVVLDDPQVEHDARSWRTRCRIMAGISIITYIPFIALVAVFAP